MTELTERSGANDLLVESGGLRDDSRESWSAFQRINRGRRAIRDFDGEPLAEEDLHAVLREALLAPSSRNGQPFVIHCVRNRDLKSACAAACRNQRAAISASALLVFVAGHRVALETGSLHRTYIESTCELSEQSKARYLQHLKSAERFLRIAPSAFWSPLHAMATAFFPSLSLIPVGPVAVRNWVARSALFAAQNVMLAASARGLDTCPMEGFNPRKLASILALRRGEVVPLVIAIGHRREDAEVEPQWRRPLEAAVRFH